ncbi:MAG: class I SAM-dependent methyltransferase [Chloroflexaceae bacterium]|jgi:ubiquinone/menaquinone biosynthesis C-methylase UbiE|nr:class I SAM-dependent methyltransferase [Chloroflexaceae bacterium]
MTDYDDFVDYYEADVGDFTEDIPFYIEMARRSGGPLLELMCGTGRVLLPLAEEGYQITGVDLSQPMLALASRKCAEAGVSERVALLHGDVRTLELPARHFPLAFVAVNSFMHLTEVKDQLAALATIRAALTRKGTLVLDLFNPDPAAMLREDSRLTLERSFELHGRQVTKFVAIDSDIARQVNYMTHIYDATDANHQMTRRTMRFSLRWFYRYELEHLLVRAGFNLRAVYGSYDLDDYHSGSPRLLAVAAPA